jgi:hypothetical protein
MLDLRLVEPSGLKPNAKEQYSFQKLSGLLADYGFSTRRTADSENGVDFIAEHFDGEPIIKVQQTGRPTIAKSYEGMGLYMAFPVSGNWYLVPHDFLVDEIRKAAPRTFESKSWTQLGGAYSWPGNATKWLMEILEPFAISGAV